MDEEELYERQALCALGTRQFNSIHCAIGVARLKRFVTIRWIRSARKRRVAVPDLP